MRKISLMITMLFCVLLGQAQNSKLKPSTTLPSTGSPEHVYTMKNANDVYANGETAPAASEEDYGLFAFYEASGIEGAYYIYSQTAKKWLTYTKADSYSNCKNFVSLSDTQVEGSYFTVESYSGDLYQMQPYTNSGSKDKYLNWFQGASSGTKLGLWQQSATEDKGSRWSFAEKIVVVRTYSISILGDKSQTIKIGEETYKNGDTYTIEGSVTRGDITVVAPAGKFATVAINDVAETIVVSFNDLTTQPATAVYTNAVLYPAQQEAVGEAKSEEKDGVYTLSNNVLAASYVNIGSALYFAGSEAMNLEPGTELFIVGFGGGDNVPASAMTLGDVVLKDLAPKENAIGGAEHYKGKALEATYEYTYMESKIEIVWRAVLRDGSHYLRTEMELTGVDDVDMYDIIAMTYNVDAKTAGSKPATVGNTRGKVIMSNKIFAGLETPTAYNTVGGAADEDMWDLVSTPVNKAVAADAWTKQAIADVPMRVQEVGGSDKTYFTYTERVTLKKNQKVVVTLTYKSGNNRYNIDGTDLLDDNSAVVASDYHFGYCGNAKENNTYTFKAPNDGEFDVRVYVDKREDTIPAGEIKIEVYEAKEGVDVSADIMNIQGRWSRNTTLAAGETWKVGAVVGLIAQDGTEADENIHNTQKRRSFLAYSERERAVPWRANPVYISWYELNINRNNAAPGSEPTNMTADQVLDVLAHWKSDMYDRYGVGANMYVIDDGWDTYGEWQFHSGFPREMRDIAAAAKELGGAGVGAWLGPVGGYGTSGGYRRAYWNGKGGMQLSNPAYYKAFKDAAFNLVCNQDGTEGYQKGSDNYTFFKFDGISAQFSAVGPDAGDTGNENAEGIIRLERYVREELREDIFFNTTVGTWASPFWYQITDATWRQENDHGEVGTNSNSRENWITYRDNLVHQNYVTASPLCPINTLMTHGFILTKFGPPASNPRDYNSVRNELRCAFLCGSGMVELYNDYDLMNSINGGALWADLAECIAWQKRNADVLPDAHWVGGDPWTGSKSEVYGWAAWNGTKSSLALRNGANDVQTYKFTLRSALNIPANVQGSIILRSAFGDQATLDGLTEGEAINIDTELTVTLPGSSVYGFEGIDATATINNVSSITLATENDETAVAANHTLVVTATLNEGVTFPAIEWTSSNPEVATVVGGLVVPKKEGTVTITATAKDGSGMSASVKLTVTAKVAEPYATNFDKTANATRSDRKIESITLTEENKEAQTITVGIAKPYVDKTSTTLSCTPGSILTVNFTKTGNWMNGYVYIDLDNDQQFSFKDGQTDQSGTDVMSYSFYTGNFNDDENDGVNSAGKSLTGNARNTMECPSFTAPEKEGNYRIRFKMDWNSIDAGGQIAADGTCTGKNGILANGGTIVDATLRVSTVATGIETSEIRSQESEIFYDLQGRRVDNPTKGVYIKNSKKVVLK